MKRNKFLINPRHIYLALTVLAVSLLSSCLKDKGTGNVNFGDSPALVAFQYAGFSATPYTVAILPDAGITYNDLEITLSVKTITQSTPVTVSLVADDAGAQKYVDADADNVDHVLPSSLYTAPSTVTIPAGQQTVKVKLTFKGDQIDFTKNYILGLKLANAQGAQLTSNLNNAIFVITLKSPYQATYTVSGSFVDKQIPTITDDGIYPISNVQLRTRNANTVIRYDPNTYGGNSGYYTGINSSGSFSVYGNFDPVFTFDPATNKVIGVINYYPGNSQGREAKLDPAVPSTSTGTPGTPGFSFTVGYILTQGGDRTFYKETFTYSGPY